MKGEREGKHEEKRRNRGGRGDDFLSGVMLGKRELRREEGVGSWEEKREGEDQHFLLPTP